MVRNTWFLLHSPDHILITADFDFKATESDINIEFLPSK